jgi:hypothetical protein
VLDNIINCTLLQCGLNKLGLWAEAWQLKISVPKCSVLHLGSANPGITYLLNNIALSISSSVRDLGVTIDTNLRFSMHINNIVARAPEGRSDFAMLQVQGP